MKSGTQEIEKEELGHKELSGQVIAAAIQVHQTLGPGFLESVYEAALCIELDLRGIRYERQKVVSLEYRGHPLIRDNVPQTARLGWEAIVKVEHYHVSARKILEAT